LFALIKVNFRPERCDATLSGQVSGDESKRGSIVVRLISFYITLKSMCIFHIQKNDQTFVGDSMDERRFATLLFADGDVDLAEAGQPAVQQSALLLGAGQRGHQRGRQADQQTNARFHSRRGSRGKGISHTAAREIFRNALSVRRRNCFFASRNTRKTHNGCLHFLSGSSLLQSALCVEQKHPTQLGLIKSSRLHPCYFLENHILRFIKHQNK
jgi:hypothetical protein